MHFFQQILRDLGVKHTVAYAKELFENRADSNTLYGVKKLLENFDLTISAIKVNDPSEVTYPCVFIDKGWIRALTKPSPKATILPGDIILLITDKGTAREPDYMKHLFQQVFKYGMPYITATAFVILTICSFLCKGGDLGFDWHKLALSLLNMVGIFFSWRTVSKECSGTCHEVLESSASKLFGVISLGVIGLSYFIGSLIIALFIPSLTPTLALVSCAALIMPVWSISYQAFVVRAWCRNCLGVQGVLILTFIAELLFNRINIANLQWLDAINLIALYVIVFFVANTIYEFVQQIRSFPKNLANNYHQMMKDPSIKESIINNGPLHDTTGASTIVINSPLIKENENRSSHELLLVISPFCNHCRELFKKINEMLDSQVLDDFKIVLVFANEPAGLPIYGSAIAEYQLHGPKAALELLSQWYNSLKIGRFRKIYANYNKSSQLMDEITRQKSWLEKNTFHGTPVMLVDSHVVSYLLLDGIVSH